MMCNERETGTATEGTHDDWQGEQNSDNESQEVFETRTDLSTDWMTDWLKVPC